MTGSLNQLLTAIEDLEEGYLDLSREQIETLLGDVKDKVDNIHNFLGRLESDQERLAKDIKILQARKRALANTQDRLKEYVLFSMESNGALLLRGKTWQVKVQKRKTIKIRDCQLEDTFEHSDFVNFEYKFNRERVLEAYKDGNEFAQSVCSDHESRFLRFSPKKED